MYLTKENQYRKATARAEVAAATAAFLAAGRRIHILPPRFASGYRAFR